MGMSSSQARLLHLTSRMHQIEYKAQKLEAQKLQLANESDRVYNDYLQALDATKVQYRCLNPDGTPTFKDATMDIMQNGIVPDYTGEKSPNILFLQTSDGKIVITPTVAEAFGIQDSSEETRDMDEYIEQTTNEHKQEIQVESGFHYEDAAPGETDVESVSIVETSKISDYRGGYTYSPVENSLGIDNLVLDCDKLQNEGPQNKNVSGNYIVNSTTINSITSIEAGKTYVVEDAAGLMKLMELSTSSNSANENTKIILNPSNGEIDMSGKTWSGFKNFKGTFDGNFCKIKNLSGSNGLIATTGGNTTVENVFLEGVNIDGDRGTGGIIGALDSSSNISVNVENCTVTGTISGGDHSGGIVGDTKYNKNSTVTISHCNVNINYTAASGACHGGIMGHGDGEINISNCNSTGEMIGNNSCVGGIFGHNYQNAKAKIEHCKTNMEIEKDPYSGHGAVIGSIETGQAGNYTIEDVEFYSKEGNPPVGNDPNGTALIFKQPVTVPSINDDGSGGLYSNIYGAILKAADGDTTNIDTQNIKNYVNALKEDPIKLPNLNDYLYKYLTNDPSVTSDLAQAILNDIQSGETNSISSITGTYTSNKYDVVISDENDSWTPQGTIAQKGKYEIPAIQTMAEELHYLSNKKYGKDDAIPLDAIEAWFSQHYDTSITSDSENGDYIANLNDGQYLANLNDKIASGSLDDIFNAINNNTKYTGTTNYSTDKWVVSIGGYTAPNVTYKQKKVIDYETVLKWDTSNPKVATAMAMWLLIQRGIRVATDYEASSIEYLSNMTLKNDAVFTTFDPAQVAQLAEMAPEDILALTEKEYNEILCIVNTSVSVETSLREVSDEKNLKKAEAKYEADMNQINRKDRKYDTELAALDTERSACKNEMETLKSVAKDNVDRTFKLFS